jgi:hypothetical protein
MDARETIRVNFIQSANVILINMHKVCRALRRKRGFKCIWIHKAMASYNNWIAHAANPPKLAHFKNT